MSGKWSTPKRCNCKDPETGKEIGRTCPKLKSRRHGKFGYATRIPSSKGVTDLRRFGFDTAGEADEAARHVWNLIGLAGADERTQRRVGDLVLEKTRHGGKLPTVEDVRRRLGLRRDLDDAGETFGEAWLAWLAMKRRSRRTSYAYNLEQMGRHWLLPVLDEIPLERLNGEHCAQVFERIGMFNEEMEAAREDGREPVLPGDLRTQPRHVGVATQHRVLAALRVMLNHAWKKAHKITFNPVYAVELEPETRGPMPIWNAAQVDRFLTVHAGDRLYCLWRLALLRGFRRGELCGLADEDVHPEQARIDVNVALLQVGAKLVWGKPKSRAGERAVGLDAGSVAAVKAHRARRKRERLRAGEAWQDSGRMFTRPDGTPLYPEYVTRRFQKLARTAGLPVIRFHAARHTAATLARVAGVDTKIVSDQLGHSTTRITEDLYQHPPIELQIGAAEKVVALLPGEKAAKEASPS